MCKKVLATALTCTCCWSHDNDQSQFPAQETQDGWLSRKLPDHHLSSGQLRSKVISPAASVPPVGVPVSQEPEFTYTWFDWLASELMLEEFSQRTHNTTDDVSSFDGSELQTWLCLKSNCIKELELWTVFEESLDLSLIRFKLKSYVHIWLGRSLLTNQPYMWTSAASP